ncbi:major outer membrane protein [Helicobacter burdigaliensis]
MALNFGIMYENSNNVNHGNGVYEPNYVGGSQIPQGGILVPGSQGLGEGLGSGADGEFGVRSFYATFTPQSTATTIKIGKQELDSPITNAYEGDRGTGIFIQNNDIDGLTLMASAFDSWAINSSNTGELINTQRYAKIAELTITKPLYSLAGIYNKDTAYGNFGAQLWGFYIKDFSDALIFSELSWKGSLFRAKAQYHYNLIDNSKDSFLAIYKDEKGNRGSHTRKNDLLALELGANFKNDYSLPLDMKLGYITNFADGTLVALENEGTGLARAGKIWWNSYSIEADMSPLYFVNDKNNRFNLDVFYANVNYGFLDERLNVGLDFVYGRQDATFKIYDDYPSPSEFQNFKTNFIEITPIISW